MELQRVIVHFAVEQLQPSTRSHTRLALSCQNRTLGWRDVSTEPAPTMNDPNLRRVLISIDNRLVALTQFRRVNSAYVALSVFEFPGFPGFLTL